MFFAFCQECSTVWWKFLEKMIGVQSFYRIAVGLETCKQSAADMLTTPGDRRHRGNQQVTQQSWLGEINKSIKNCLAFGCKNDGVRAGRETTEELAHHRKDCIQATQFAAERGLLVLQKGCALHRPRS